MAGGTTRQLTVTNTWLRTARRNATPPNGIRLRDNNNNNCARSGNFQIRPEFSRFQHIRLHVITRNEPLGAFRPGVGKSGYPGPGHRTGKRSGFFLSSIRRPGRRNGKSLRRIQKKKKTTNAFFRSLDDDCATLLPTETVYEKPYEFPSFLVKFSSKNPWSSSGQEINKTPTRPRATYSSGRKAMITETKSIVRKQNPLRRAHDDRNTAAVRSAVSSVTVRVSHRPYTVFDVTDDSILFDY